MRSLKVLSANKNSLTTSTAPSGGIHVNNAETSYDVIVSSASTSMSLIFSTKSDELATWWHDCPTKGLMISVRCLATLYVTESILLIIGLNGLFYGHWEERKMMEQTQLDTVLKVFSWETDLWVTLGDFTVKKQKNGKGNLYLTENRLGWNKMCCAADNHNYMHHIGAKEFLDSIFN